MILIWPYLLIVFMLGLAVGSFLNVLIDRLPNHHSLLGRSKCDFCGVTLRVSNLIPLLSFVYQKARCADCAKPLSFQYPLIELLTGVWFMMIFLRFPYPVFVFWLIIFSGLIALFFIDVKYGLLPNKIVYPLILITTLYLGFNHAQMPSAVLITNFLAAIGAALFFMFLILITRGRGMGGGDMKLAFLLALLSGWPGTLITLYAAFIIGGIFALALLITGRKKFGQTIAFGPFLILGFVTQLFFGHYFKWLGVLFGT